MRSSEKRMTASRVGGKNYNDTKNKATRHIITQIAVSNGVPLTRSYRGRPSPSEPLYK